MLLKGILLGIVASILSLFLFYRWMYSAFGVPPNTAAISVDIRGLERLAISFYGGIGIGFVIVLMLYSGAMYAFWRYAQHVMQAGRIVK
jgi:hypothetical protein